MAAIVAGGIDAWIVAALGQGLAVSIAPSGSGFVASVRLPNGTNVSGTGATVLTAFQSLQTAVLSALSSSIASFNATSTALS